MVMERTDKDKGIYISIGEERAKGRFNLLLEGIREVLFKKYNDVFLVHKKISQFWDILDRKEGVDKTDFIITDRRIDELFKIQMASKHIKELENTKGFGYAGLLSSNFIFIIEGLHLDNARGFSKKITLSATFSLTEEVPAGKDFFENEGLAKDMVICKKTEKREGRIFDSIEAIEKGLDSFMFFWGIKDKEEYPKIKGKIFELIQKCHSEM